MPNWNLKTIWKDYDLSIGLPFSLLIAIIGTLPRLLGLSTSGFSQYGQMALSYLLFSFCSWMINHWLANNYFAERKKEYIFVFLIVSTICGLLTAAFFKNVLGIMHDGPPPSMIPRLHLTQYPDTQWVAVFFVRIGLFNFINAFFTLHLRKLKEHERHEVEMQQLKQANLQANLSSLKEQLSPHFLFNALNTANSLSTEAPVKGFVQELAKVYRYLLQYQTRDLATVGQELKFVDSYLFVLKARLEEAINVSTSVHDSVLKSVIPPFSIQLLLENAIKHNVTSRKTPLYLTVHTDNDYLVIRNNVQPKVNVTDTVGIGLHNIAQRYKLLFGKEIIIQEHSGMFTVKLPIIP